GQRVFHRAPVEPAVHDTLAVVRERDASRLRQLGQLGELLAAQILRDRADRIDPHDPFDLRLGEDVVRHRAVVVDGTGIRHAAHRGEAAGGRGPRTGRDRLFIFLSGLAQVHVHVDESGTDDLAARVDDLDVGRALEAPTEPRDLTVLDQYVLDGIDAVGRIDHAAAADQETHALSPPLRPASSSKTPIRTATPRET